MFHSKKIWWNLWMLSVGLIIFKTGPQWHKHALSKAMLGCSIRNIFHFVRPVLSRSYLLFLTSFYCFGLCLWCSPSCDFLSFSLLCALLPSLASLSSVEMGIPKGSFHRMVWPERCRQISLQGFYLLVMDISLFPPFSLDWCLQLPTRKWRWNTHWTLGRV